jgi:hypothetical protein
VKKSGTCHAKCAWACGPPLEMKVTASAPRKRGSMSGSNWIPAFAGMTTLDAPAASIVIPAKAGIQLLCLTHGGHDPRSRPHPVLPLPGCDQKSRSSTYAPLRGLGRRRPCSLASHFRKEPLVDGPYIVLHVCAACPRPALGPTRRKQCMRQARNSADFQSGRWRVRRERRRWPRPQLCSPRRMD